MVRKVKSGRIGSAIRQARERHRAILEETYDGSCNVYGLIHEKNPKTKVMESREVLLFSNLPCHLSYSGETAATSSSTLNTVQQGIQLFLAPETHIEAGSRIEVTQNQRTENYVQSGKAAVYTSHQEILLELWKGYA